MNTSGKYVKHGLTHSRVRNIWKGMIRRCYNQNDSMYRWYGAKGIRVCDRWRELLNFVEDMGHPPEGLTLDRIDPKGNYEPRNCRWLSLSEQQRNRTNHHWIEFDGKRKRMTDWANDLGMSVQTLANRLRSGMPPERALTRPVGRWADRA